VLCVGRTSSPPVCVVNGRWIITINHDSVCTKRVVIDGYYPSVYLNHNGKSHINIFPASLASHIDKYKNFFTLCSPCILITFNNLTNKCTLFYLSAFVGLIIEKYKNITRKILLCKASIYFNQEYLIRNVISYYAKFKIRRTS
jgi:hypothetical protein